MFARLANVAGRAFFLLPTIGYQKSCPVTLKQRQQILTNFNIAPNYGFRQEVAKSFLHYRNPIVLLDKIPVMSLIFPLFQPPVTDFRVT